MNTATLTNLTSTLGSNKGGFMYIDYCPVEWLAQEVAVDLDTLHVKTGLSLIAGKQMLRLKCMSESIEYTEKPKDGAAGPYVEQVCTAVVNLDDENKSIQLNALRHYKLILVLPDKNNRTRIMGTKAAGARLTHETTVESDTAGKSFYQLKFELNAEDAAPFLVL